MHRIVEGIQKFHDRVFPSQREWYEQLALKQQKPRALFITCADSRINPNLITQTEPGDLFILRNAGNIVPSYGSASGGEGATIEYAVSVLGVQHIIICGHSHCGAMQALLRHDGLDDLPAVRSWFGHAEATRQIMRSKYPVGLNGQTNLVAAKENVLVQLNHLRTHPSVAAGLAAGKVNIYGWVYVIEAGEVLGYNPESGNFEALHLNVPNPVDTHNLMVETCEAGGH